MLLEQRAVDKELRKNDEILSITKEKVHGLEVKLTRIVAKRQLLEDKLEDNTAKYNEVETDGRKSIPSFINFSKEQRRSSYKIWQSIDIRDSSTAFQRKIDSIKAKLIAMERRKEQYEMGKRAHDELKDEHHALVVRDQGLLAQEKSIRKEKASLLLYVDKLQENITFLVERRKKEQKQLNLKILEINKIQSNLKWIQGVLDQEYNVKMRY